MQLQEQILEEGNAVFQYMLQIPAEVLGLGLLRSPLALEAGADESKELHCEEQVG